MIGVRDKCNSELILRLAPENYEPATLNLCPQNARHVLVLVNRNQLYLMALRHWLIGLSSSYEAGKLAVVSLVQSMTDIEDPVTSTAANTTGPPVN